MEKNTPHPLIVRGGDNVIEIPERLRTGVAIKNLTNTTRGRFSTHSYTIQEVGDLLGGSSPIDATHTPYLDLIGTIQMQNTILIQLMSHKRWKILCLLDMVAQGWSGLETHPEGQIGIFHTGSRLSLGRISSQYLINDSQEVEISTLLEEQKKQPDIIAWRDKTF